MATDRTQRPAMPGSQPIHLRAGELEQPLNARRQHGETLASIVRRDLDRYYRLLRRETPTFPRGEAALIVDALNGSLMDATSAPLLWAEVADAVEQDGLAAKWQVDGDALVARLRRLTPFQAMAVCDAAERYWLRTHDGTRTLDEALRAVGLVAPEAPPHA